MPVARALALCLVVAVATTAAADYPFQMNYQVMLTDDYDQPLASQPVTMEFTLYDAESGGTALWTETQEVTTNSIGVASVVLGAVNPITLWTFDQMWLDVHVNGEAMLPRRPLTEAAYAAAALVASEAFNAEELNYVPAEEYALYVDLSSPGTVNNPSNPLEWTRLKSVPAGFADGVDNTGSGDGHSLDASDGSPTDALYVDEEGRVRVGPPAFPGGARVSVATVSDIAASFGTYAESPTMIVYNLDDTITNPKTMEVCLGDSFPASTLALPLAFNASTSYSVGGDGNGTAGFFSGHGTWPTLWTTKITGDGSALYSEVRDLYGASGFSGHFVNGDGVLIERGSSYPALDIDNSATGEAGDAVWISSASGAASNTWALYSFCYQGEAGRFSKYVDDGQYTARVLGNTVSSMGLYVQGTIVYTGAAARSIETSRGREAVHAVNAPESEVVASGTASLTGGRARVEFDRLFTEAIDVAADIRVTATPTGAWSALYTESIDGRGFDVRSGAGASDVEFHWMAIGRSADWESGRSLVLPDPEEDARLAAEKEAQNARRRPSDRPRGIYKTGHTR